MVKRDWEAERAWLLRLPTSPETDAKQDQWTKEKQEDEIRD